MSTQTAVVVGVGAERGLGAALCRRFGAERYHVLVAGRTPEKLAQVVKTIAAAGGSAEAITVDMKAAIKIKRRITKLGTKWIRQQTITLLVIERIVGVAVEIESVESLAVVI